MNLPVDLPTGWTVEECSFGVLIEAPNPDGRIIGGMTVSEKARGYTPGIAPVRMPVGIAPYRGRGSRKNLYQDAIASPITITGWRG
ncbi:hypothetical protein HAV18_17760 [Burkholderia sp. D-99]|nr:hypothetical protein [Burkholderia sp. D-99]